jgi:hypothetical protein
MCERMFALLLRLYPAHFRREYEDEALQLIRDRLCDETGFFKRVRLWWDLLTDLLAGLAQAYPNSYAAAEAMPLSSNADGIPSFRALDMEPLRRGSILVGGAVSLAAMTAFGFVLSRPIAYQPNLDSKGRMSPIEMVLERLNPATTPDAAAGGATEAAYAASAGTREQQLRPWSAATASASKPETPASLQESKGGVGEQGRVVFIRTQNSAEHFSHLASHLASYPVGSLTPSGTLLRSAPDLMAQGATIDAAEQQRVFDAVIENLKDHYYDHNIAQKMADALLAHEQAGDDALSSGDAYARLLTRQMRDVSHDLYLDVVYSPEPLPDLSRTPSPEDRAPYRRMLEQQNCTFEKVEILPHNIGYFKLNSFPEAEFCGQKAMAAMAALNHADAVIFDLRDNRGGMPSMVALIGAYLFDHPEYWYNPREATTEQSFTKSPVAGNKLADKPVYVLTSHSTFSGAEQFTYDLKMLKRVTIVGETTGGRAHAGVFHRIDDHFGIGIPEVKAINPYGPNGWAEVGVEPDVKVKAADALETAEKLAESRVRK